MVTNLRVLIVSQYFWPEDFRINDLAATLAEKGVEVEVLTGKPNYPEGRPFPDYRVGGYQREEWRGATVHRVPLFPRGQRSAARLALNYLSFVFFGCVVGAWKLRKHPFDVIFVYGTSPILQAIPALLIGWLKKKKVVVWVQDLWPESLEATGYVKNPIALGMMKSVVRGIYRHSDLLLVQSKAFIPRVEAMAGGTPVTYYPNSVDPAFGAPPSGELPAIAALDAGFCVLFAGNVGVGQAVEVIVEAATLLRDQPGISFVVLGNGSRWDWMQEQVHARQLTNLHLPGRFPVKAMPGLMQKAAALLVTLADEPIFAETVPNKVQAYMASGKPILACLNGEGARRIQDEARAGLAVPAENGAALAAAVLGLFHMPLAERDIMGARGRSYFRENFDHDRLTDQLIDHFGSLIPPTPPDDK